MRLSEIEDPLWHGKHVVQQIGEFRIAVDQPGRATYVTVWTPDNKRIGSLSTRGGQIKDQYLGIGSAQLDRKYRGKGLGSAMYRTLITNLAPQWLGIASYLPDRANRRQVPKIYRRLGSTRLPGWADHAIIPRRDAPLTESQAVTPQNVTEAIKEMTAELIRDGYATDAYSVNDGMCETLAEDVVRNLGGETDHLYTIDALNFCLDNDSDPYWDAKLLQRSWPKCQPTNGLTWRDIKYHVPSHVWIVFQHRHYDAEAPEGVDNFFELPLIRRGMEAIAAKKKPT